MKDYKTHLDQELLYLVSNDNKAAFAELYSRYWQPMFVIAFNRIKEKETAEDIVHDVFASLWANRKKVNIECLENYLAVAVKYVVLAKLKREIREREIQENMEGARVIELPIESSLHYKKILEVVTAEVERLPEKCKLIFKYSRNEGMPVKRIASELKLSPKTVENQLTKAISQLRLAARGFLHSVLP
jgi:RNA polymerase sigma-70 factor (family 1)